MVRGGDGEVRKLSHACGWVSTGSVAIRRRGFARFELTKVRVEARSGEAFEKGQSRSGPSFGSTEMPGFVNDQYQTRKSG
jgi:hypothetical protein